MAADFILFDQGDVISSEDWKAIHESYVRSIQSIGHPATQGHLLLRRKVRLPNGQFTRNGVGYLRSTFLDHMRGVEGWEIGRRRGFEPWPGTARD